MTFALAASGDVIMLLLLLFARDDIGERRRRKLLMSHFAVTQKFERERLCVHFEGVKSGDFFSFSPFLFLLPNSTELWHLSFSFPFPFLLFALVVDCVSPFFSRQQLFTVLVLQARMERTC